MANEIAEEDVEGRGEISKKWRERERDEDRVRVIDPTSVCSDEVYG